MTDFFNRIGRLLSVGKTSFRRHQHRKRHVDELFIPTDCVQSSAYVAGDLTRAALLDLKASAP